MHPSVKVYSPSLNKQKNLSLIKRRKIDTSRLRTLEGSLRRFDISLVYLP